MVVTSTLGYPAVGEVKLQGGKGGDLQVTDLAIPAKYTDASAPGGPARAVFYSYKRLAQDFKAGTTLSATFDDVVVLHKVIDAVEMSAKGRSRKAL